MTIGTNTDDKSGWTPAELTVVSETPYGSRSYKIVVGFFRDGEIPQYVVLNRETGVAEFNNEVSCFAREWVLHFQKRLDALDAGKDPEDEQSEQPAQLRQAGAFN